MGEKVEEKEKTKGGKVSGMNVRRKESFLDAVF